MMDTVSRCVLLALVLGNVVHGRTFVRVRRQAETSDEVTLTTPQGEVKGQRLEENGLALGVFYSIPYAKPPLGNRRFTPPEAADVWSGIRDATSLRGRCLNRPISGSPVLNGVPDTEDCLFVDIYAPLTNSSDSHYPVMFYLHGGGFYGGSGSLYNFTNLALTEVVVISVNFRLDALGFLSTEDASSPGNVGLLDVVLALQWLQDNVAAYGGNADDVTLFGGSSGAAMISALLLSPLGKGLFHKAIMQSGVALCPWAVNQLGNDFQRPRKVAGLLGSQLNCSFGLDTSQYTVYNSEQLMHCLREADGQDIIDASTRLVEDQFSGDSMIWTMVVEDTFQTLPDTPAKLLARGLEPLPTIYGYTAQDGSWLVPGWSPGAVTLQDFKLTILAAVQAWLEPQDLDERMAKILEEYLPAHEEASKTPSELRDILVQAITDASMTAFIMQEARMYGGSHSYMYEFNYRASYDNYLPDWYGVGHGSEKGFVQGLPQGPVGYIYTSNEADQTVANHVLTLWSNFAKHSNPSPTPVNGVTWPPFEGNSGEKILVIQENLSVKSLPTKRRRQMGAWSDPINTGNGASPSLTCPLTIFALALAAFLHQLTS